VTPLVLLLARLAAVGLPLGLLAYWRRIYPHTALVLAATLPGLISLTLFAGSALWIPLLILDLLLALMAAVDLFSLPSRRALSVTRQCQRAASLDKHHPITLNVTNHSGRPLLVWIRDGVPPSLRPEPDGFKLRIAPRSRALLSYRVTPARRGAFEFPRVYLRVRSRFGMWVRYFDWAVTSQLHVYPDMQQLRQYAVLARTDRLSLMGVRRVRRIGQDNEFERLRDYTQDDNFKHIDWRTTARRRKLTVREFQRNQSQRLIFLIDCGRMMTNTVQGLSLLDHSLNAMLMLSYVALSHGDSVGLLCFDDEIRTFVPPRSGGRQMNRLLHGSFDRFPRRVESRYDQAFLYLAQHCRKRSLVVLISNVIDEVNAHQIRDHLSAQAGKHLPLAVLLRDHGVFDAADSPADLYRAAAAADLLTWRQRVLSELGGRGVLTLDVFPDELTAPLVNRYLSIKARQLL